MGEYKDYDDLIDFMSDIMPTLKGIKYDDSRVVLDYGEQGCLVFDRDGFIESFIYYTKDGKRDLQD